MAEGQERTETVPVPFHGAAADPNSVLPRELIVISLFYIFIFIYIFFYFFILWPPLTRQLTRVCLLKDRLVKKDKGY